MEITQGKYTSSGFEISYKTSAEWASPEEAVDAWKHSSGHNAVMINEGAWAYQEFKAMGCGIYHGVAHVWFATGKDTTGTLSRC